ncbi:MAG: hypothetical protein ACI4RD_03025 [Kiritimatiellia bacterium]
MKRIIILAAVAAATALTGCQTRITAEKYPEQVLPIQQKVTVDGEERLITTHYQIASGGWYATARSPLYAAEALEGLEIGVTTNGSVSLALGKYGRDLSTNSVVMVDNMFAGGAKLIEQIGVTYAKIAGGGAQADTVTSLAVKAYQAFVGSGGDVDKASVTSDETAKTVSISDGSVCTVCTADGACSTGSCADK